MRVCILGAFIALVCNLIISFFRIYELVQTYQYPGIHALFYVIMVGAVFLMGALNLAVARIKKLPVSIPSVIAVWMCLTLFAWGNIRAGLDYGWEGILLNLATTASIVITYEFLLSLVMDLKSEKIPPQSSTD